MAGLTDILNTARDALSAQAYGLGVTGQNVANVNTTGYVRRRADLQSQPLGSASFGTVVVKGVQRLADQYTEQRHYAAVGLSSSAAESDRLLGHVEGLFDLSTGLDIGSSLGHLFSAFSTLTADPSDMAARAQVVQRAGSFASSLNVAASTIASFKGELTGEALGVAGDVNALAADLAKVNQRISMAENSGDHASDLKDDRDRMLLELSSLVDVHTFSNNQGQLVIQGAGTTLVEGDVARKLDVGLTGDGKLQLWSVSKSGAKSDVSQFLKSGKLAAIRDLHDVHTTEVLDRLNAFAFDVASAINDQHSSGFALDGSTGNLLFDISAGPVNAASTLAVNATIANQPELIAASSSASGVPGDGDNALALAQLAGRKLATGGTRTAAEAYGDIVGDVGMRKAQASRDSVVREAMTAQLYTQRESVSGVNLDEEMISLTKYQRAYEASSRVLTTVDQLLEQLINTLGR